MMATACACTAALLSREFGLLAAVVCSLAAISGSLWRKKTGSWLLAVPAALGAVSLPEPSILSPRPGPVWIDASVLPGQRHDPGRNQTILRLANDAGEFLCVVEGRIDVLPGDTLRGPARLTEQSNRQRHGRPPIIETARGALTRITGPPSLTRLVEACRITLEASILDCIDGEAGTLLCHLVLGDGPPMPEDLQNAHRATGLAHLLAVSGAHASMLGWMLGLLYTSLLGRSPLASRWYRRLCAAFLLLYGAITGMEPPVFRAVMAFIIVLAAAARGRRVTATTALALPALLTALFVPRDLFSASFCLSYAAVIGLVLSGAFRSETWHRRWLLTPFLASCWATLTTAPLTLLYFGQIAPWTIFATPLLAPLVALMLALGLTLSTLGMVISGLAILLTPTLTGLTCGYCEAVRAIALLPMAPIRANSLPSSSLLLAFGLFGLLCLTYRPNRRGVALLCAAMSLPHFLPPPSPSPGLKLLAVGHGQACLTTLRDGQSVLIDCGSLGQAQRAARAVRDALLPARSIDLLILTHGDHDHVGGIHRLLQNVSILRAVAPARMAGRDTIQQLRSHGVDVDLLDAGDRIDIGADVSITLPLVPPSSITNNDNDHSLWVRLELGSFVALVPGDPLEAGVAAWLQRPDAGEADLLILPHHGRSNTHAAELLDFVQPDLALVSNRDGESRTVQAIIAQHQGIEVLQTGTVGTIDVTGADPPLVHMQFPPPLLR